MTNQGAAATQPPQQGIYDSEKGGCFSESKRACCGACGSWPAIIKSWTDQAIAGKTSDQGAMMAATLARPGKYYHPKCRARCHECGKPSKDDQGGHTRDGYRVIQYTAFPASAAKIKARHAAFRQI